MVRAVAPTWRSRTKPSFSKAKTLLGGKGFLQPGISVRGNAPFHALQTPKKFRRNGKAAEVGQVEDLSPVRSSLCEVRQLFQGADGEQIKMRCKFMPTQSD
jgi:hypothetical protein